MKTRITWVADIVVSEEGEEPTVVVRLQVEGEFEGSMAFEYAFPLRDHESDYEDSPLIDAIKQASNEIRAGAEDRWKPRPTLPKFGNPGHNLKKASDERGRERWTDES